MFLHCILVVYFFLLLQTVESSPCFLPFTVGYLYIFLYSLCIAFIFIFILCLYSIISVSILITSVLNSASDFWLSPRHLVLICSFIWAILFFVLVRLLCYKGWSLRYSPGWGNPLHCIVALYVGEGSEREQCRLLSSCPTFSHFSCYPQANWALLVLTPR